MVKSFGQAATNRQKFLFGFVFLLTGAQIAVAMVFAEDSTAKLAILAAAGLVLVLLGSMWFSGAYEHSVSAADDGNVKEIMLNPLIGTGRMSGPSSGPSKRNDEHVESDTVPELFANDIIREASGRRVSTAFHRMLHYDQLDNQNAKIGSMSVSVKAGDPGDDLIAMIRKSVVGNYKQLWGPFGTRRITYMDYTASGRMLGFVEDYMREAVAPLYANTHTEASFTGMQTTYFREEARALVAEALHASEEDYCVLFTGTGCTAAINKIVNVLGLWIPEQWKGRLEEHIEEKERPIVFHGPYEHHSNELMWRESIATTICIPEDANGHPDQTYLAEMMERYADRPLKIGSFSAGSNVTGIVPPITEITALLHSKGFLAFWDFAGSGAYIKVDMQPMAGEEYAIDAGFFSPHKYVGGPGSSGVLVAKRSLFKNKIPTVPGGGTVSWVDQHKNIYETDPEAMEDGGTPGILQAIKCGLVHHIKTQVGSELIESLQYDFALRAIRSWEGNPNIMLMGHDRGGYKDRRTSIISFMIRYQRNGNDLLLHQHFVIALLNDLYGIQARSGCSCAGPYAERLFGWAVFTDDITEVIGQHQHSVKPGWARVNFNYFLDEETFDFVVEAVHQIATEGWKLLPLYRVDACSGMFYFRGFEHTDDVRLIHEANFNRETGRFQFKVGGNSKDDPRTYLDEALKVYRDAVQHVAAVAADLWETDGDFVGGQPLDENVESNYRYYVLPSQAALDLGLLPPGETLDTAEQRKEFMKRRLSRFYAGPAVKKSSRSVDVSGGGDGGSRPTSGRQANPRNSVLPPEEQQQRGKYLNRIASSAVMLRSRPRG